MLGGWVGGCGECGGLDDWPIIFLWVGWWPPRLLSQPQSPLGPFGPLWALLGLELGWNGLGLGLGGLETKGLGTRD